MLWSMGLQGVRYGLQIEQQQKVKGIKHINISLLHKLLTILWAPLWSWALWADSFVCSKCTPAKLHEIILPTNFPKFGKQAHVVI